MYHKRRIIIIITLGSVNFKTDKLRRSHRTSITDTETYFHLENKRLITRNIIISAWALEETLQKDQFVVNLSSLYSQIRPAYLYPSSGKNLFLNIPVYCVVHVMPSTESLKNNLRNRRQQNTTSSKTVTHNLFILMHYKQNRSF